MKPNEDHITHEKLKESVCAAYDRIEVTDGEESWNRMEKRLQAMQRRSRLLTTLKLGTAIASVSLVIGLLNTPNDTLAFKNLFSMTKESERGWVHVLFGEETKVDNDGAKTPPPPDYTEEPGRSNESEPFSGVIQPVDITVEEAKQMLDFPIRTLSEVPEGYKLKRMVTYPEVDGNYRTAMIEYEHDSGSLFFINQTLLEKDSTGWKRTINQASGKIKDVYINGQAGVLILYTNGGARIEWLSDDVVIEVYGDLTEEEILAIANGMKGGDTGNRKRNESKRE